MPAADGDAEGVTERPPERARIANLLRVLGAADPTAAAARVAALRRADPEATPDALAARILASACRRTAAVGAATSGAAVVPGLGTLVSLTLGTTADLAATLRLQAQLVLEIAAAYRFPLDRLDARTVTLIVTGVGGGSAMLVESAGQRLSLRAGERLAGRWVAHALPVLGVAASAGTNAAATYLIGTRAVAYVRGGPEAVVSWADRARALSGFDERRVASWIGERGAEAGTALRAGVRRVKDAGAAAIGRVGAWLPEGGPQAGSRAGAAPTCPSRLC